MSNMTDSQKRALDWFRQHGGDGVLIRGNAVLAAGEVAPHTWGTFKALEKARAVERYGFDDRRIRLVEGGPT